jgi:hypothetical protein
MSKARLVITAITVEKRAVSEVARSYRVARSRVVVARIRSSWTNVPDRSLLHAAARC